jgi:hypothetical protein
MVDVARLVRTHGREVRLSILAVLLAVVLLCVMAWRPESPVALDAGGAQPFGRGDLRVAAAAFGISGSAAGSISPGADVALDLRITNPHSEPMAVTSIKVTLRKVRAPNADGTHPCSPADFVLYHSAASLHVTVPASSTRTLGSLDPARYAWPHVRMRNRSVNQDGCKGASLVFDYTGSGALSK